MCAASSPLKAGLAGSVGYVALKEIGLDPATNQARNTGSPGIASRAESESRPRIPDPQLASNVRRTEAEPHRRAEELLGESLVNRLVAKKTPMTGRVRRRPRQWLPCE